MKEMFKSLNAMRKETPSEFWGSLVYLIGFVGFLWLCILFDTITKD